MYLIFSHYGKSPYLETVLKWNRMIWGDKLIFIGDTENCSLVKACGWNFIHMDEMMITRKRKEFSDCYQDVSGEHHSDWKNGRNWLKYVFERWFLIEELVEAIGENEFFHFDSDVLLTSKEGLLSIANNLRKNGKVTSQCNDGCLNGYIDLGILSKFTSSIIAQFKDPELLEAYKKEFKINTGYAFTEMRAFDNFNNESPVSTHALTLDGWILDDCLAQSQGFETELLWNGREIKKIYFRDGVPHFRNANGELIPVAALNFSWLETSFINYAQLLINQKKERIGLRRKRDIIYLPKYFKRRYL